MARIIIADDDKLIHKIYAKTIEYLGHEIVKCLNGKEAVEEVTKEPADLIILDNLMPELDGYEACQAIRKLPNGIATPIIIVSADDSQEEILKFLNAGANDYLLKPVSEAILIAKLKNFLKTASLHKNELEMVREKAVIADRYKIEKVLGYGSHSVVFLAADQKKDNEKVAVKLLNHNVVSEDLVAPITKMALKIQEADLENVVKVLDFGQYSGNIYLILEYAEGGDLATQLKKKGKLSEKEIMRVGLDITKALNALNKNNLLHLDIKPENIMIHKGSYMLSDFGVMAEKSTSTMALNPEIWGTPAYSSPEILVDDEKVSLKSDIYSFGVTLYESLIGDNPFVSEKPSVSMFRQLNLHPTSLLDMEGNFSIELSVLIDMMISKQPFQRPGPEELDKTFSYMATCMKGGPDIQLTYLDKPATTLEEGPAPRVIEEADEKIEEVVSDFSKATNVELHTHSWKRVVSSVSMPYFSVKKLKGFDIQSKIVKVAIALIAFFAIYLTTVAVSSIFSQTPAKYDFNGLPSVVICEDCTTSAVQPVIDIRDSKCTKCSGQAWYAMRCNGCQKAFPLNEDKMNDEDLSDEDDLDLDDQLAKLYSCPFCKSLDTGEVMVNKREE